MVEALCDADVCPDAVLVGNEISRGMLWPKGKVHWEWDPSNPGKAWRRLVRLINKGTSGILDAIPAGTPKPKILMHLDIGGDAEYTENWLNAFFFYGGICDGVGLSYYTWWQGTFDDLFENIYNIDDKFPKLDIWLAETAYYWSEGQPPETMPYPQTQEGQYLYLKDLRERLLETKVSHAFYWGSHWVQPWKWFVADEEWSDPDSRALFDWDAKATKGILALPGL